MKNKQRCKCKAKGCKRKSVVKKLCSKHYMRQRRTGDPNQTRKAGRKRDPWRAKCLAQGFSPRTIARYLKALKLFNRFSNAEQLRQDAIEQISFKSGGYNISRLLEIAIEVDYSFDKIDQPETDAPKSV